MTHQLLIICMNLGHGHNYFMNLHLIYQKSSFFSQDSGKYKEGVTWNKAAPFSLVVLKRGTFFPFEDIATGFIYVYIPYEREKRS